MLIGPQYLKPSSYQTHPTVNIKSSSRLSLYKMALMRKFHGKQAGVKKSNLSLLVSPGIIIEPWRGHVISKIACQSYSEPEYVSTETVKTIFVITPQPNNGVYSVINVQTYESPVFVNNLYSYVSWLICPSYSPSMNNLYLRATFCYLNLPTSLPVHE